MFKSNYIYIAGLAALSCASVPTKPAEANQPAAKERKTFSMNYQVVIDINAAPETVWAILTDAAKYPEWNSTIESVTGQIALDEKIRLKAKIAPDREFKLKISTFDAPLRLVWEDGSFIFRGVRTFTLERLGERQTRFTMVEVFSGAMMPMIAGSLPDFSDAFTAFAQDLKRASEHGKK